MRNRTQRFATLLIDVVTMNTAWTLYYVLRVRSGWIPVGTTPDFLAPMIAICAFWLVVFLIAGLYRPWYAASRLDEVTLLFKSVSFGCLFLFFAIFIDDEGRTIGSSSRLLIAVYWTLLLGFLTVGRMAIRSLQRRMLIAGMGARNTLIVGSAARSRELFDQVRKYPAFGLRVIGFASVDRRRVGSDYKGVKVLGSIDDLPALVDRQDVSELLIALDSADHDRLIDIIARCNGHKVGLKIMPDLYDIISGQARTNQLYGFPLIEINPELMRPWEEAVKRGLDVLVALVILVVGLPVWLLITVAIKLETRGTVLYRQERVGKDGEIFKMIKFRSMVADAETMGPRWAGKKDPRITRVGKLLRQLHLDEVPQMINVLRGQMSLIGPRPERPVFVQELSKEIPLYMRRLKVRPGITGWAQVKHKYDESVEDVRKKVQYDLFYIENMSIRMDFKIIVSTVYHMLLGKGR